MIKIEVTSKVEERNFVSKAGKPISLVEQHCYLHSPDEKYPRALKILPPKGGQPYAPGFYTLSDASYYVDRYGSLAISPRLTPVAATAATAPRAA